MGESYRGLLDIYSRYINIMRDQVFRPAMAELEALEEVALEHFVISLKQGDARKTAQEYRNNLLAIAATKQSLISKRDILKQALARRHLPIIAK